MSLAPAIQHFTPTDGLRLAYTVWGSGHPLLRLPGWPSDQRLLIQHPSERDFAEALAAAVPSWMLIMFDQRGAGLSDAIRYDFSLDGMVGEVLDLIDHLKLRQVTLLCPSVAALVGVAFAALHPKRVSRLIVINGAAQGAAFARLRSVTALSAIARIPREERYIGAEVLAHLLHPSPEIGTVEAIIQGLENRTSLELRLALWAAYHSFDVRELLPRITAPCLVLHSCGDRVVHLASGVELAGGIPGARFLPIEGDSHLLFRGGESTAMRQAIVAYLEEGEPGSPATTHDAPAARDASLSPRQIEVLRLIAQGKSSREIADALVLSERTVHRHTANLYAKLGVRNRVEATTVARLIAPNGIES